MYRPSDLSVWASRNRGDTYRSMVLGIITSPVLRLHSCRSAVV